MATQKNSTQTDNKNQDTDTDEGEGKKRGQSRKSPEELRAAFNAVRDQIGLEGLKMKVEEDGRCSLFYVTDEDIKSVIKPTAGNTFLRQLEGAVALIPYAKGAGTSA